MWWVEILLGELRRLGLEGAPLGLAECKRPAGVGNASSSLEEDGPGFQSGVTEGQADSEI